LCLQSGIADCLQLFQRGELRELCDKIGIARRTSDPG
jgi:hypothetical protein